MTQPKAPPAQDEIREYLTWAVPLAAAELAHKLRTWGHTPEQAERWLTSEAHRAGALVGERGDLLVFACPGGTQRARAAGVATRLATGIAAIVLLAQLRGDRPEVAAAAHPTLREFVAELGEAGRLTPGPSGATGRRDRLKPGSPAGSTPASGTNPPPVTSTTRRTP